MLGMNCLEEVAKEVWEFGKMLGLAGQGDDMKIIKELEGSG